MSTGNDLITSISVGCRQGGWMIAPNRATPLSDIYLIVSIIDQSTAQSTNHQSIKDIIDQPSID